VVDVVRIALCIEYAGDAFEGWQSQRHGRTVQDVLEAAIERIAGEFVRLQVAGRTDTGVHATAQVAHFDTTARRPVTAWVRGVNTHLPRTVVVKWAVEVDDRFHARFLAYERAYRYILYNSPSRPAAMAGKVGWFHPPLDESRMVEAASLLVGKHDFSAFRASCCQSKTPVRVMYDARVSRAGDYLALDFRANGFLHHMVRNLVGALVYIGKGHYPPEWLGEVLERGDRSIAAPTFEAAGLYLCGVAYPPDWPLPGDGRIISQPQLPLL
jgi:tRNA pseudouridine38-40 synthase